jgi:predicted SprT family Zn-dependent metalloprotease
MKDTVQKRIYKCKCGTTLEEYVWSSEIRQKEFKCTKCKSTLGFNHIKVDKVVSIVSIRTPTKNR